MPRAKRNWCCGPRNVVDENFARPMKSAARAIITERIEKFSGLRLKEGLDYDVVNVEQDARYRELWTTYHRLMERRGVTWSRWPRSKCGAA